MINSHFWYKQRNTSHISQLQPTNQIFCSIVAKKIKCVITTFHSYWIFLSFFIASFAMLFAMGKTNSNSLKSCRKTKHISFFSSFPFFAWVKWTGGNLDYSHLFVYIFIRSMKNQEKNKMKTTTFFPGANTSSSPLFSCNKYKYVLNTEPQTQKIAVGTSEKV